MVLAPVNGVPNRLAADTRLYAHRLLGLHQSSIKPSHAMRRLISLSTRTQLSPPSVPFDQLPTGMSRQDPHLDVAVMDFAGGIVALQRERAVSDFSPREIGGW